MQWKLIRGMLQTNDSFSDTSKFINVYCPQTIGRIEDAQKSADAFHEHIEGKPVGCGIWCSKFIVESKGGKDYAILQCNSPVIEYPLEVIEEPDQYKDI
jgi:hypothetical protein